MKTLLILLSAVILAAVIVLRGMPAQGSPEKRRRRRRKVRFEDSFLVTVPASSAPPAQSGFSFDVSPGRDERPPRPWSFVKIVVAIAFVAALGAAGIWFLGYFLNAQLARLLSS